MISLCSEKREIPSIIGRDFCGGLLFSGGGSSSVLGMFFEVGLAAFFFGERALFFGFRFAEADGEEKAMNAFFVALFEEKR